MWQGLGLGGRVVHHLMRRYKYNEEFVQNFIRVVALAALVFACGVSANKPDAELRAIDVASDYVRSNLKWDCGEYIVDIDRYMLVSASKNEIIIRATHRDDIYSNQPGSGHSVQITVDGNDWTVISVLKYQ
ncbi:hypothetical protein [Shewanella fidelis]|uniref:NTF2 fold domain-containing protein n=1 Tax=Shewanella fidelis TaxID=173509 RepID=A0AAW8NIM2_9GAMM|nr:hypothetical protein [Shewanella fidelis]MDR8523178.1 hypothetical protein [Shewanella fidelis]MDW4811496.1 hypothetical protein [Shewanella fidelis]MDW4815617.1 hypothetical protein [Shewanella fidelis]MDW4819707.1 hypothetical protein [Shewanella fidelis]MDW4824319.1 hypothetical protein [Shewanella fidelis]